MAPTTSWWLFSVEECGSQHDYLMLAVAEMWNWLEDKLIRA